MNESFKPQNPEDDERITESAGNPKEPELPPNPSDGLNDPNLQDSLFDKDNQEADEQDEFHSQDFLVDFLVDVANQEAVNQRINQLFRQLRVFQPLNEKGRIEELVDIDEYSKIQIKKINVQIYQQLSSALSSQGWKMTAQNPYFWDAFNATWLWTTERYNPDHPDEGKRNFLNFFMSKYKFLYGSFGDLERKAKGIRAKKVKKSQADDGQSQKSKTQTKYVYPQGLDEPIRNRDGSQSLLDILQMEDPPDRINMKQVIAWFKSEPDILRQTPCFPRREGSPTAGDVGLLLVKFYEQGEECTVKKLQEELGVSSQFYDFYRHKFIPLVREHFEQSEYNTGEE